MRERKKDKMTHTGVLALAVALALTGCSAPQVETKTTPTPTVSVSAQPSATSTLTLETKAASAAEYARIMEMLRPSVSQWNALVTKQSTSSKKWAKVCSGYSKVEAAQWQALAAWQWPADVQAEVEAVVDAITRERAQMKACASAPDSNAYIALSSGEANSDVSAASMKARLVLGLPLDAK